mmetsp:Transcript_36661/g.57262  ORF Transcript_36661/g.57262 Transcript_36661/m.57262 type:complete len:162 (-) Transcript_36661:19-504(-)
MGGLAAFTPLAAVTLVVPCAALTPWNFHEFEPRREQPTPNPVSSFLIASAMSIPVWGAYWCGGVSPAPALKSHELGLRFPPKKYEKDSKNRYQSNFKDDPIRSTILMVACLIFVCLADVSCCERWSNNLAGFGCSLCGSAQSCCLAIFEGIHDPVLVQYTI